MLKKIDIRYIFHSGFQVDINGISLFFDYYQGSLPVFNENTKAYFFSSHSHEDHFNPIILDQVGSENFSYIFSSDIYDLDTEEKIISLGDKEEDIEKRKKFHKPNIHYLDPYENLILADMEVRTFGSTDKGVSFLVNIDSVSIFHAGDLNLWIWDEDTPQEREQMTADFMKELDKLSLFDVDIGFFPLDPRLKDRYADGFNLFIDKVKPSLVFPMHFRDDISKNLAYLSDYKENQDIFRPILKNNQTFLVNYES